MSKYNSLEEILDKTSLDNSIIANELEKIEYERKRVSKKIIDSSSADSSDDSINSFSDEEPLIIPSKRHRKSIFNDTAVKKTFVPEIFEKSYEEKTRIIEVLSKSLLFNEFDYDKLIEIIDIMKVKTFKSSQTLM